MQQSAAQRWAVALLPCAWQVLYGPAPGALLDGTPLGRPPPAPEAQSVHMCQAEGIKGD